MEKRKARYEAEIEQILEEAERIDAEEDTLYGDQDGYSLPRSYTPDEIEKALKKINRNKERLARKSEKLNEKIRVVNDKIDRLGSGRNSFGNTDQDATLMLMKGGGLGVGYNVQMATENQIIVAYRVYQKPNDVQLLQPMIEEVEQNLGTKPAAIVTDKGYCSQSNYEFVAAKGIKAAIPPHTLDYDRTARRQGIYKYSQNITYEKNEGKDDGLPGNGGGRGINGKEKEGYRTHVRRHQA